MGVINYGKNDKDVRETLKKMRLKFGCFNQLLVSIEELNELACVLAKIPRYDTVDEALENIHDKVVDEVSDVLIVMDHVIKICNLTDEDIYDRLSKKVDRIKRWNASENGGMKVTTVDREV